jgi:hypothetical protein
MIARPIKAPFTSVCLLPYACVRAYVVHRACIVRAFLYGASWSLSLSLWATWSLSREPLSLCELVPLSLGELVPLSLRELVPLSLGELVPLPLPLRLCLLFPSSGAQLRLSLPFSLSASPSLSLGFSQPPFLSPFRILCPPPLYLALSLRQLPTCCHSLNPKPKT